MDSKTELEFARDLIKRQNLEIYWLYKQSTDFYIYKTPDKNSTVYKTWNDAKKYLDKL